MIEGAARYRRDVDGLRAVAIAVVVAFHAFPALLPGGFIGVDAFFVISGYLITGIIVGAIQAERFTFRHFYARRIRRIFPALVVVLTFVLIVGWYELFADDFQQLGRHVAAGAGFFSNFILWSESGYFADAAATKPLLHLWSLGIEEQFYVIWPLLLVASARWRRGPLVLTLVLGTVSFAVAVQTVRIDPTAAFYAPWTRFWELLVGGALACAERDQRLSRSIEALVSQPAIANGLAIAGAVAMTAGLVLIDETRIFPGLWVLLPTGGTFLLLVAGQRAWLNRTVLSTHVLVWVGLISYPLYLWHWPLLSFAQHMVGDTPSVTVRLVLVGASVVLAWVTYRVIEWPVRFGLNRAWTVPALGAAMATLFVVGAATPSVVGSISRANNRSDPASFIWFYNQMRRGGIAGPYHAECDFMNWDTGQVRPSIDPSCTTPGRAHTIFLWGDSFAQSLSAGIRAQLPPDTALAQVATSACTAAIRNFDMSQPGRRCERANLFAMDSIRRLRPSLVIIAQRRRHTNTDWQELSRRVSELGAGGTLLVGPFAQWRPSLPQVVARSHWGGTDPYIGSGLRLEIFDEDRRLAEAVRGTPQLTYLSLLDHLCRDRACLARVPNEDNLDLMAYDDGHLTPKASVYVAREILKPHLDLAISDRGAR